MKSDVLKYLILDDEEIARLAVENEADKFSFLKKIGSCAHPVEAFELIGLFNPDIVFLDIEMPVMNGIDFLRRRAKQSILPILIKPNPCFKYT